ncbi:MAG: molybdopterin-binding protein [Desulfovibrio sp.]|nr:MAG: molybdopterin-binding protein [Desulfovibrio sp.]
MMKRIPVQDAVGTVLCHDLTKIVPGEFKGRAFQKGHVVRDEDIPMLRDMGKEHLYVLTLEQGMLHENDAARRICSAAAGRGLALTEVCEGRINLTAEYHGLLSINIPALDRVNSQEGVVLATAHTHQSVKPGRQVAGARVVPLVIEEERIQAVEAICASAHPVIEIKPFASWNVGLVTTGSEVYHGRIQDAFGPIVRDKFAAYGSQVLDQRFTSDDPELTAQAIREFIGQDAHMVVCTGGMSVDPDDQTPASIRAVAHEVVTYGSPTFPGAMFMLAYAGDVPILGLPGCVMYHKASIFELVVPRMLAGERLTRQDIARMGHGGLCAGCGDCRYPLCPFGKGV